MTQLNKTFERTPALIPAAGLLLAAAVAVGALATGLGRGGQGGLSPAQPAAPAPVTVTRAERAAILSRLDSEYLREISAGWYITAPRPDPTDIRSRLYSEYLREISKNW
jgi:hypothetical protein